MKRLWALIKRFYLVVDFVFLKLFGNVFISWGCGLVVYILSKNGAIDLSRTVFLPFTSVYIDHPSLIFFIVFFLFIFPLFFKKTLQKRYPKGLKYALNCHKMPLKRHKQPQNMAVKVVVKPQKSVNVGEVVANLPPHLKRLLADG